jgi:N-acetylglutamate synthase-like GNAT family acetyltransferase
MRTLSRIPRVALIVFLAGRGLALAQTAAPAPTPQELFPKDVHAKAGLTCETCHGAMAGGRYAPVKRTDVAPLCARCHADATYMHKFNAKIPVDQHANWKQSVHAAALAHGDTSAPTCSTCHGAHGVQPVAVAHPEQVCWQCHVREADFYKASPKKKIFEETDHPGCVTCHENHKIVKPGDNWISMKDPVSPCSTCHDADMKGAKDIVLMQQGLKDMNAGIARATLVLDRAERVGMLVDDGRQALRDAAEHQIQARVTVHTFASKPFGEAASLGIKDAARAEQIGNQALSELQFRRKGLMVATVLILGFLVTLGFYIRRLPPFAK